MTFDDLLTSAHHPLRLSLVRIVSARHGAMAGSPPGRRR